MRKPQLDGDLRRNRSGGEIGRMEVVVATEVVAPFGAYFMRGRCVLP